MPIPLRSDFDAAQLRGVARRTKDAPQARRLLTLAAIYEGATRTRGGDWRCDAADRAGLGGEVQRPRSRWPRRPQGARAALRLNDGHRAALATMIESGPMPAVHGVVRWRLIDLCQWLFEEFRITVARPDLEPGAAGHGLPEALGPAAAPRSGRGSGRGF